MKDLLSLILSNITTHPEEVQILEAHDEGRLVYTISVHPEDMGRVIGKSGKVIKAIRSLAHVIAIRKNLRYRINVAEVGGEVRDFEQEGYEETPSISDDVASGEIQLDEIELADNEQEEK